MNKFKIGKLDKDVKGLLSAIAAMFFVISFVVGVVPGTRFNSSTGRMDSFDCEYESLIQIINIPYVIGCELGRRRFKENK